MSFSKAKIHRFNDDIPCAPPPGTYNPAPINKTVGPIIYKHDRFSEGKDVFLTASCESLNTLHENDSCQTPFNEFKTPKIPASSGRFEMKRSSSFSHRKSSSTEYICKRGLSSNSYEITSLKYSLNEVQEELALERNKTNNLLKEVQKMKENYEQADHYTETLISVLNEKTDLITVLEEKCSTLENITAESFESYFKHITGVYEIFETYFKDWEKSETEFAQIFQKYEDLVSNYESYFQDITSFLGDLIRRSNSVDIRLSEPVTKSEAEIMEMLGESEKERKKYELVVHGMQKVITVLSNRVLESDQEVEKLSDELNLLKEENKKVNDTFQQKDDQMRSLAMNFLNEIKTTEQDLLCLVDILKEKALNEKKMFEKQLVKKNIFITKLQMEKSQKELELQESLDLIETLKCKDETSEKILQQVRSEYSELKTLLEDCQQQLNNQRTFYDENYLQDVSGEMNVTFTKDQSDVSKKLEKIDEVNDQDLCTEKHVFFKYLCDFTAEQMNSSGDKTNNLFDVLQNEACFENKTSITTEDVKSKFESLGSDKVEWLRSMMNLTYNTFYKFNIENNTLKNNYDRLRNDFIEKCDECAQLTQLLQVSEKRVEYFESQINELESCKKELEEKLSAQMSEIKDLKNDRIILEENLTEQKFETKNNEHLIESLKEDLAKLREKVEVENDHKDDEKVIKLENSLKEAQTKIRTAEKENSRLNKLVGPYRQTLEKYEAETKFMSSKPESDIVKKYSKLLDQQNTKQKMKQITKLRGDIVQLRKKNEELQTEINKFRKVAQKSGKENKIGVKNDFGEKVVRAEIPVNSTYVITSPKVNRI